MIEVIIVGVVMLISILTYDIINKGFPFEEKEDCEHFTCVKCPECLNEIHLNNQESTTMTLGIQFTCPYCLTSLKSKAS